MMLFDTHIHLQDMPDITPEDLNASGIFQCICVSAKDTDWPNVSFWADKLPQTVIPAYAVHPWYIGLTDKDWGYHLESLLIDNPRALVGECGFDLLKNENINEQAQVFEKHIFLANKYKRTLLIHAVKAWELMEAYWRKLPPKFVFHSFNARPEQLKRILKFGGYISVNKSILRNKTSHEILTYVPKDRLLLETDAPFQSNLEDLRPLCLEIAKIRHEKLEDLAQALYDNAMEIVKNG